MFIRYAFQTIFLAVLLVNTPVMAYQDCNRASVLNNKALDLPNERAYYPQQKRLLNQALQQCPNHPESHNNLADIFEREQNYPQAIYHYRQALKARPGYSNAWYGLGETYYKQGQFPLSLEAHLHACKTDKDSKARIVELLKNNQYAVTEEGQILEKESLLLLYDKSRRQMMGKLISACGFRAKIRHVIVFRNIVFNTNAMTLKKSSTKQIQKIAAALKVIKPTLVKVKGHSDAQPWRRRSKAESKRLNLRLSQRRAETVKNLLVSQGFPSRRMRAEGYGGSQPLVSGNSKAAWAKNRRVEIEVN